MNLWGQDSIGYSKLRWNEKAEAEVGAVTEGGHRQGHGFVKGELHEETDTALMSFVVCVAAVLVSSYFDGLIKR